MIEKPIDPLTNGPQCSNCQVVIADPWFTRMGPIHHLEERNLEENINSNKQFLIISYPIFSILFSKYSSRLACCILVEPWMNEMII